MPRRRLLGALVGTALLAAACGDDGPAATATTTSAPPGTTTASTTTTAVPTTFPAVPPVALETVVTGLDAPVAVVAPPGDDRLFVLERFAGTVRIVREGALLPEPFLDVRDRLVAHGEDEPAELGERGLLGLAFHPDYATNGRFFVYWAGLTGIPELVEYRVSADDADRADPASAVVLHEFDQSRKHFGGTLLFAPDGALWLSIGDGLRARQAQDLTSLRGKLLRFDVTTPGEAVPAEGNPYLGAHLGADEIWASGLRNPWRFTIDAETGLLYVADVGARDDEEISVVPADEPGLDLGWPVFEAGRCADPARCDDEGLVAPVVELSHADGACAVIGGVVYRGAAIPALQGAYLYTDYCDDTLRSFRFVDGEVVDEQELLTRLGGITSFGTDADGEVYLVDQATATLFRLVPA